MTRKGGKLSVRGSRTGREERADRQEKTEQPHKEFKKEQGQGMRKHCRNPKNHRKSGMHARKGIDYHYCQTKNEWAISQKQDTARGLAENRKTSVLSRRVDARRTRGKPNQGILYPSGGKSP